MQTLYEKLNTIAHELNMKNSFQEISGSLWCDIDDKEMLLKLTELMKYLNARVCMITAYAQEDGQDLVYHFDINGVMVNLKLFINDHKVPSITPLFKSADWAERELSEIYHIEIENHPNPQRLFLDESIKESVLNEYFSLSTAMSNKVTQALWDKVKAQKGVIHG